jgi:LL-diaminopimelate aminotransferase
MQPNDQTTIQFKPSDRFAFFKPYFFYTLDQKIDRLRSQNMDIIRFDIGSPDLPPPDFILEALIQALRLPHNHGYMPHGGTSKFREAIAKYYKNRFNVSLDPAREALGLLGSKEGLFHLGQALLNPGDIALVPDPGYPVYQNTSRMAGAEIYFLQIDPNNHFLPDLTLIPNDIAQRAKILWLNYPNNPTGAVAPLEYLKEVVAFARKYHIVIAYDAPYCDVSYDDYFAPSILQVSDAKDVAIEFNSFSKTYNMAGWRLGMAVGNPKLIEILSNYKSQSDSSTFAPLMEAGIAAINGDQNWIIERNLVYQRRRDFIVQSLAKAGFDVLCPKAAIYVWAHIPKGFDSSIQFCDTILTQTGVSLTPGTVYGQHGEGFIRLSLTVEDKRLQLGIQRLIQAVM